MCAPCFKFVSYILLWIIFSLWLLNCCVVVGRRVWSLSRTVCATYSALVLREQLLRLQTNWSLLIDIGRNPFLPSWNLHKVELFSAFISHLDDISSWKCSWKCKSLQFERKKKLIPKKVGCEPTPPMVQYTALTTRPLRICWIGVK